MSTTSKVMVGASWVILIELQSKQQVLHVCLLNYMCPCCNWMHCLQKGGNLRACMHACIQTKQLQFWSNTMFNVEFDPWMCMIFKEDIYVHDWYLNGWCSGHRPNLRRVVIGWTMTFKNITFNTCLRFPRIRISSLCHMWPGKFFGYISISEWRVERTTFQYKNEYFSLILDCICSQILQVLFSCHHAMLFCSSFLPLLTIGYFLARVF
jgi:hypothetical protein